MTTFYIIRQAHKEQGDFYNPLLWHQDEPISQKGLEASVKLWLYLSSKHLSILLTRAFKSVFSRIESFCYTARRHRKLDLFFGFLGLLSKK